MIDHTVVGPARFVQAVVRPFGALDASQQAGPARMVSRTGQDKAVMDLHRATGRPAAVRHACAGQRAPGAKAGDGQNRPCGRPAQVKDTKRGHHTGIDDGRGEVRPTWDGDDHVDARTTINGHDQAPVAGHAGEFAAIGRTLGSAWLPGRGTGA